jgi:hypothetical protein
LRIKGPSCYSNERNRDLVEEDLMTERADFRKFYRDAHAVTNLSEREKVFMGLAVALARNCQY